MFGPWLVAVGACLLATIPFAWERWCDPLLEGSQRCFSAKIWAGSASLLGALAVVLIVSFLIASVVRGPRSNPSPGLLAVAAGMLGTVTAKAVIAGTNGAMTSDAQPYGNPAMLPTLVGLVAPIVGGIVLIGSIALARRRRLAIVAASIVVAIVVAVSVPYAASGLAWWGGPLAEPQFLGGGNAVGMRVEPDQPIVFQGLLYLHDLGSVAATLDGLDLVDPFGRIRVLGTYVVEGSRPCSSAAVDVGARDQQGQCFYPLNGYRIEPGGIGDSVLLAFVFEVSEPGRFRSAWFRIRYHVGPLRFEIFRTDVLQVCAPEPGRKHCPAGI